MFYNPLGFTALMTLICKYHQNCAAADSDLEAFLAIMQCLAVLHLCI